MDTQKLPPELRGLSTEQLNAALEFARENTVNPETSALVDSKKSVEPISNNSGSALEHRSDAALEPVNKIQLVEKSKTVAQPVELNENLDIAALLADGKVSNPQALLEQVLNLSRKTENEDTAFKA